jgi:2',3'-cyclic-nucleotide 2'-phosphodiesterase/3'-nucleotidase/5'-nucleotidase
MTSGNTFGAGLLARCAAIGVLSALASACGEPGADAESVTKSEQALWRVPSLTPLGQVFHEGAFGEGAAEIVAFDPRSARLFVTNVPMARVDIIDAADPSALVQLGSIDVTPYGKQANSVAVWRGTVAVAIEAVDKQSPGKVGFFDSEGTYINSVEVGALPDMVTFTPDGERLLVANEGEPSADYTVDPEGSVSVIDLRRGVRRLRQSDVRTAGFTAFSAETLPPGVRIFGPGASIAQDLEPEYIAVSEDSKTAWVTLQENNAIAVVDIRRALVTNILPLGLKDHSLPGNGLDVLDKDLTIKIENYPIFGLYMPDSIASFRVWGRDYYVMANEGDAREYDGYVEAIDCPKLPLDPLAFPAGSISPDLARIDCSQGSGDLDGDGDFDQMHVFGARSFSILDQRGRRVFDSGDEIEQITAAELPTEFNSNEDVNGSLDNRSDNKGPEPEGLAVGTVRGRTYAFIGLERIGGVLVFDVSNPFAPNFIQYVNTRDFSTPTPEGSDSAPEGLKFISARESPIGKALLAVSYEMSGTTRLFQFD